ncbi:MAG TPA: four helix bundle protein [Gemmatimonadaceae bacterium]|nr:four helix bundle protein [Gemmatimonadaceae bacterium]
MSDFKKLRVWRKAHALAINIHSAAGHVRGPHLASLRSQMVRAALSISTNIVEGSGQQSRREFGRFIRIALNSASELEYHLIVARDIKAIAPSDVDALANQTMEVRRMLHGLLARVTATAQQAKGPGS